MRSFLRAVWGTLWFFAIPKEPFGLILVWPATLIAGAGFAFSPTAPRGHLVLLALAWDISMGFWQMVSAMKKPRDALYSTVLRLKDCSYHEIPLQGFLGESRAAAVLSRSSMLDLLGRWGLPYSHRNDVRIFRVEIGESGTLPHDLGAFNIPFIEAVLLLRDHPDEADITERFYFWHEFGHTLGSEFAMQSGFEKGVKNPLLALLLAGCVITATWPSVLSLAMCLIATWTLHRMLQKQKRRFRAISEMKADEFALEFLTPEERGYALARPDQLLPTDRDLSSREKRERVDNIRSRIRGGSSPPDDDPDSSAFAFFPDLLLVSANLVGWMILLSRCVAAPTHRMLLIAGGMTGIAFAVAVVRWVGHYWRGILIELMFIRSRHGEAAADVVRRVRQYWRGRLFERAFSRGRHGRAEKADARRAAHTLESGAHLNP
jgi:hypothetical protein